MACEEFNEKKEVRTTSHMGFWPRHNLGNFASVALSWQSTPWQGPLRGGAHREFARIVTLANRVQRPLQVQPQDEKTTSLRSVPAFDLHRRFGAAHQQDAGEAHPQRPSPVSPAALLLPPQPRRQLLQHHHLGPRQGPRPPQRPQAVRPNAPTRRRLLQRPPLRLRPLFRRR